MRLPLRLTTQYHQHGSGQGVAHWGNRRDRPIDCERSPRSRRICMQSSFFQTLQHLCIDTSNIDIGSLRLHPRRLRRQTPTHRPRKERRHNPTMRSHSPRGRTRRSPEGNRYRSQQRRPVRSTHSNQYCDGGQGSGCQAVYSLWLHHGLCAGGDYVVAR